MLEKKYTLGKGIDAWGRERALTVTFIITEDCNLRCKYCYIVHKRSNSKMEFDTAKQAVDCLLTSMEKRKSEPVIIEFIGGEPLIEVELIDRVCDYFKIRAYELGHDWYWNYRFSITTNGVNYGDASVQNFIKKNLNKLSITMTVDGTKEKHDMQRVFPNGDGSYNIISSNFDLYLSQFAKATKVTFASPDLHLLKDSIVHLWEIGFTDISANVIFEDGWSEGDDVIYEEQLKSLADYVLENELFDKYKCTLFDDTLGSYQVEPDLAMTSCGAGKMLAIGTDGTMYPCNRYAPYSLNKKEPIKFGDVKNGIDMEKVRPFMLATFSNQSDQECLNCEVAVGCGFCQGLCYDESELGTNFYRTKYICKMHKARVRANDYYFSRLYNRYKIARSMVREQKRLYFLLADDFVDYCSYHNISEKNKIMDDRQILEGLEYARRNFFVPYFVHSKSEFSFTNKPVYGKYLITHILPANFIEESSDLECLPVFDKDNIDSVVCGNQKMGNCMLNVMCNDIRNLSVYVKKVFAVLNTSPYRINLNIQEIDKNFDENEYIAQLAIIKDLIGYYFDKGIICEVSLITDLPHLLEHANCKAGDRSFVYAPDGNIYPCSAFYSLGTDGIPSHSLKDASLYNNSSHLFKSKNHPLCANCDAYQCMNCIYINKKYTNEVNVSPSFQCRKSNIERGITQQLQTERGTIDAMAMHDYLDPINEYFNKAHHHNELGYYSYKK
ncbi:radical SAM domain protein [Ruminiclostridium papyrosolvens DSM 2782]|uniref:Radical SAM domain protein n=1 Tax=Ruminiclostridium papyrosolvens DSM 2782 TaxID=588581 RepID=F1TEX4_9FIRM|nr:radical SAM peptide maturase, CXXX-repeat target family [Ruminiclostridium papyrosolvens]EGD46912.1 radical SAM domain protein [Ruminiclostridium papyrosolvens DSM 2782]WES33837.1 radical SAM peptide maturase, CXXX-repeat target family [Ruminiclostridium papyrosolvens DSM 2782]